MEVSEAPIFRESLPFVICERARTEALHEVGEAGSDVARYEAVLVANSLWQRQMEIVTELVEEAGKLSRYDPDLQVFSAWLEAWLEMQGGGSSTRTSSSTCLAETRPSR